MSAQFGRRAGGATPTPSPTPTPGPTLIDTTSGLAAFSAAPWLPNNLVLASAGVAGPDGIGNATRFTSTGAFDLLYRGQTGQRTMRARVKAGTTSLFSLYMDTPGFTAAIFDLASGAVVSNGLGSAAIVALGGGWWQIEASGQCSGNLGFGPDVNGAAGVDALLFDFSLYG